MSGAIAAAAIASGCTESFPPIPSVDGPLELAVRHPTESLAVRGDRVSTWGAVGTGRATLEVNGRPIRVEANGAFVASVAVPRGPNPALDFTAVVGGRELTRRVALVRAPGAAKPEPISAAGWVTLGRSATDSLDGAAARHPITARHSPGGRYAMSLPVGVRLPIDARTPDAVRVRLAKGRRVWISALDADTLAAPRTEPLRLGRPDSTERNGTIEVSVAVAEPLPSAVELEGTRLRWMILGAGDESTDMEFALAAPPLGWRTRWADGRLTLQIRPPRADTGLAGLVVALDAGHPPAGTSGPTGLREDSVTIAIARAAARRLEARGARPILVRPDARPLSLAARLAAAEAADAQVYVSIHLDAPSDEETPGQADGTLTLYHHLSSLALAQALHDSVAESMRQRRRGVRHSSLVVLRATWFPSVLIEGTCLVLPEREAWLRTTEGIGAYADGIVRGLARWAQRSCLDPRACR